MRSFSRFFSQLSSSQKTSKIQDEKLTAEPPSDPNTIPNILHFIWAGGEKISDNEFNSIKSWKAQNPAYQVKLWVDRKTTSANDIEEMKKLGMATNVEICDINDYEDLVTLPIRHELDSVFPNYGHTSDLLRSNFRIVWRHLFR